MASMLSTVTRGGSIKPPRTVIYGTDKIGKTTFAAGAPNPVFIRAEDGEGLLDVAAFPKVTSYQDILDAVLALRDEPHEYKTLVLDSLDWVERHLWRHVCEQNRKANIEDFGYGKGYQYARDEWGKLLTLLDDLRTERRMGIIGICHSEIKRFDSPTSEPYDRYQLKLHKAASALVAEWADVIGFAHFRVVIESTEVGFKKEVNRAESLGRALFLEEQPAFDAGNRFGLPSWIPLEYAHYRQALATAIAAARPVPAAVPTPPPTE